MNHMLEAIGAGALILAVLVVVSCSDPGPPTPPSALDDSAAQPAVTPEQPTKTPAKGGACACESRQSLAPLITKLQPSVVNIYATKIRQQFNPLAPFFNIPQSVIKQQSLGSGFIFNASEGLVVTNHHVVAKAQQVKVRLSDRRELTATLLGSDPAIDLALLRVQPATKLREVVTGDSDQLQVGDWVLAIGNPFGLSQTVTVGIVSALSRTIGAGPYDDFIQTDASINPGNSGGPLFDMQGRVVGINTAIHREGHGIGFAIPMSMARPLLDQIRATGRVVRGYLGVVFQDVTADHAQTLGLQGPNGAYVVEVYPGSPAARAGLRPGDIIVEFNNHEINVASNLPTQVARTRSGVTVPVVVLRGGQRVTVNATLVQRPQQPVAPPSQQPWPNLRTPGQPRQPGYPPQQAPNRRNPFGP